LGPRFEGEHVGESVDLLDHAGVVEGLPVLAAEPFQAGTFGVRLRGWLAGVRCGLDPDPAVWLLGDAEPLGAGLVLVEAGVQEGVADHGGGDADAGRRLVRLGPQPVVAVEVNDPAGAGGPGAEFEQEDRAFGGGGEPHDGRLVTVSARCGELGGMELLPPALVRGLDLEEPCAGAVVSGRAPGGPDHAAAAGAGVLPLLPRGAGPVIAEGRSGRAG
jgi:hypothetical protein